MEFFMSPDKKDFISLAIESKVLQWGQFTLKSGRVSPYFFNTGFFYHNHALKMLGEHYAQLILNANLEIHTLFGPAYKGFTLATTTALALAHQHYAVQVSFNRKEPKDHGEGGSIIGGPLNQGPVFMIDDVITAGTAFRETHALITHHGGQLQGVLLALDRCERGQSDTSAIDEIKQHGLSVHALINFFDLIDYLEEEKQTSQINLMYAYHKTYGTREKR